MSVDVALGIQNGQVLLHWHGARDAITFDPQNAYEMGEAMARAAHKARFGEDPPSDHSYIAGQVRARATDELRTKLVTRIALMLRSLEDKDRGYAARQIVDTVLSEVG